MQMIALNGRSQAGTETPVFNIAVCLISFQNINDISWLNTKQNSSRLSSISHKIWSRTNTHHMETCNMAWMSWKSSFFWFLISLYIIFIFAESYKKTWQIIVLDCDLGWLLLVKWSTAWSISWQQHAFLLFVMLTVSFNFRLVLCQMCYTEG